MTIDPYGYSPCGAPKKIKFYCPELIPDLEKIERMLQGEQRVACLDFVQKLAEKHPGHSVPLYYTAVLQLQMGSEENAKVAVENFLEAHPDNPAAHALNASYLGSNQQVELAIDELQTAIELSSDQLHVTVYEAIGVMVQIMLMSGNITAARAHLMFQVNIAPEDDNRPLQMLMRLNSSPELPLLLKQDPTLAECPEDYNRTEVFDAALRDAGQGRWRKAVEAFEELRSGAPRNAAILENLAVLYSSLGNTDKAISCLKSFAAATERGDLESAAEALALANLLEQNEADMIDVVVLSYEISDMEGLLEKLRVHPQTEALNIDVSQLSQEDTPAPKVGYWLLDKAIPETAENLTIETAPNTLGEILIYGKETDREARLEISTAEGEQFEETKQLLSLVCEGLISNAPEQRSEGQVPKIQASLTWSWRLPNDTTSEQRQDLIQQKREQVLLEKWPKLQYAMLENKAPEQAVGDPKVRSALAAAILQLELSGQQQRWNFDYNRLREVLKIPPLQTIDPELTDVSSLPVNRLSRLDSSKLNDDDLVNCYSRASTRGMFVATNSFALELLERESVKDQIDIAELYGQLAKSAETSEKAIDYLQKAQQTCVSESRSPAIWKIAELSIQIERRNAQQAQSLMDDLIQNHVREPGIAEALSQVMYQAGMIGPDGRPVGPMANPEAASPAAPAQAAPSEEGGLWTPDGSSSASPSEEKKSKLWVPGMD